MRAARGERLLGTLERSRANGSSSTLAGVDIVRAARPLPDLVDAFRTGGARHRCRGSRRVVPSSTARSSSTSSAPSGSRRSRRRPSSARRTAGAGRRRRLRHRLVEHRDGSCVPRDHVHGLDLDEYVIAVARANAEAEGLADRVTFSVADASDPDLSETFDLVTIFEALHDMSRPVEASAARDARRRRLGRDRRRAGRGRLHRAGADRGAPLVRVERGLVPAVGDGRSGDGGHRGRDATLGPAALCGGGRVRRVRDPLRSRPTSGGSTYCGLG